jgi:hypothetical protein
MLPPGSLASRMILSGAQEAKQVLQVVEKKALKEGETKKKTLKKERIRRKPVKQNLNRDLL